MKIQFLPILNFKNGYFLNNLPSFCQFRKVGQAQIIDRKTGEEINATIKKENMLDEYISYQMLVKNNLIGYIDITVHPEAPKKAEQNANNPISYETMPEVSHLRSIEGDKYAKIGSTLINLAIEESKNHDGKGAIWLEAEKGYKKAESAYRSDENPIPFYYKLGFRAVDQSDEKIRQLIENGNIEELPDKAILVLEPDNISYNAYLARNYSFINKK